VDLRDDYNGNRVEGALPKIFDVTRAFDAAAKFSGPQKFVEAVDNAIWDFYESVARHIQAWHPSTVREQEEVIAADRSTEPSPTLTLAEPLHRQVVQRGEFEWGSFELFADGSIDVARNGAKQWFRNFAELERDLKSLNGQGGSTEPSDPQAQSSVPVFPIPQ
jgi:hypothetical protein